MATVTPLMLESMDADTRGADAGRILPGLSSTEAERRLTEFGPNEIRREHATASQSHAARRIDHRHMARRTGTPEWRARDHI